MGKIIGTATKGPSGTPALCPTKQAPALCRGAKPHRALQRPLLPPLVPAAKAMWGIPKLSPTVQCPPGPTGQGAVCPVDCQPRDPHPRGGSHGAPRPTHGLLYTKRPALAGGPNASFLRPQGVRHGQGAARGTSGGQGARLWTGPPGVPLGAGAGLDLSLISSLSSEPTGSQTVAGTWEGAWVWGTAGPEHGVAQNPSPR